MMIVMKEDATQDQIDAVVKRVESVGAHAHVSEGEVLTVIGAIGDRERIANLDLDGTDGVDRVVPITKPYKLASMQFNHGEESVVEVDGRKVGGGNFSLMAGPCTVESRHQLLATAEAVKEGGASMLRGGAYKPRTSPYSFQGLGDEGLRLLAEAKARDRPADRDRADGPARPRRGARGGRRDPGRRAQHAELLAAGRDRPLGPRRAARSAGCPRRSRSC